MSACLPAFRALGSAFPPSSFSLLAQVKWNVLTNTGASGYVGNARLMRAHWLSLHWMVVIQTAVCVCLSVSVCLVVGRCCPSSPLIMLITQTGWAVFAPGTDCCSFSIYNPPAPPLRPLSFWYLSISHQSTSPLLSQLSPCALHSSPEVMGEGERETERDRTGLHCW